MSVSVIYTAPVINDIIDEEERVKHTLLYGAKQNKNLKFKLGAVEKLRWHKMERFKNKIMLTRMTIAWNSRPYAQN